MEELGRGSLYQAHELSIFQTGLFSPVRAPVAGAGSSNSASLRPPKPAPYNGPPCTSAWCVECQKPPAPSLRLLLLHSRGHPRLSAVQHPQPVHSFDNCLAHKDPTSTHNRPERHLQDFNILVVSRS